MKTCALALLALLLPFSAFAGSSIDDCHAEFGAYAGARPYIVNPASDRDATAIVVVFDYPAAPATGTVAWTLSVRSQETGDVVRTFSGRSTLIPGVQASIERRWDGRTAAGTPVRDGNYTIEVDARFVTRASRPRSGEPLERTREQLAASSPVAVIVDRAGRYDALFARESIERRRLRLLATSIDPSFPYQFFYGNTHAHTMWSDGGMPVTDCVSGRYGYAGGAQPVDAFSYARSTGSVDFLAVVEHNHLMQEGCSGCTAAEVIARYGNGFAAAQNATVPGSFVGLWGMEWGVISGGGHVNIYNQPNLMSWTGEPFDVDTPKSNYPALYDALAANQGTLGSFGTFNHPNSTDFGSWTRPASGDSVMRGLAIVSGPAFSTSTSFTPGGTTYTARYNQALSYGWKVAPESHQDNHCWNFGNSTPNRTVALIPSATAFDQSSLLAAIDARRIYAAQDRDMQLRWATADGAHVMGDSFAASAAVAVRAAVSDPAGEGVQRIEIWGGKAGTVAAPGAAPSVVASILSSDTLDAQLTPAAAGEEWYYYVVAVQADGDTVWSAPVWITWGGSGGGGDTTAPAVSLTAPASGATVSGSVLVAATASDDTGVARVEFRVDGALQATRTAAPYEWTWNSAGVANGTHTVGATAFDAAGNSAVSSASVTVSNGGGGGGASLDLSGWVLTQANSASQYTIPAGTTIPAGGYLVVARNATKAAFETFWGTTLGTNAVFLNAANTMPVINGDETYTLSDGAATVDGPTIAMGASAGQSLQRTDLCGAAGNAASWSIAASTAGTPGSGAPAGCGAGARISEFSDALGTGNYIYEFLEIYNDADGGTADTTPPAATITAPAAGSNVSGSVSIGVSATDDTGVTSVAFFVDGTVAATLTAAPWQLLWDTTAVANGAHTIGATAYDAAGNAGAAPSISVTVDNDLTPPVVSVTAPASGANVSGTVSVTASATDAGGIASVAFLLDGVVQSTDATAPYAWNWDTLTATNGAHTLAARATDAAGNAATSTAVSVTVSNDVTPPAVSITAPASGATVAGTVNVTASATDASGIASVAFLLNGVVQSTDTTAPYAWSWNSTTVADGTYTLEARATDAVGNAATSTAVPVNVDNVVVTGTDISGWRVTQSNAALTWYLPAGTVIPSSGYVVIARNATKAAFETFWGTTLGPNVVFINAADGMPQINGSESYSLYNGGGTRVDGATVAMASAGGESLQRIKPCTGANKAAAWSRLSASSGSPGRGAPAPCGKGVFISEFSDALGMSNYVYEFVELHNDR